MIGLRIITRGADVIARRFRLKVATLPLENDAVVRANANLLLMKIRARASGRPGPEIVTGEYVASWQVNRQGIGNYVVSTDAPQARRLERGFAAVDSLGRHYSQPPFPHVWPAADEVENAMMRDMSVMVTRGL